MKIRVSRRIRQSFVLQQGEADCGVACLLSVIRYYDGAEVSLHKLRRLSGTSISGTTVLGLFEASKHCGFDAAGMQASELNDLRTLSGPAILHVTLHGRMQHFVVLYESHNDMAIIGDPAIGIVIVPWSELEKIWISKVLLTLSCNSSFQTGQSDAANRLLWIKSLIKADFDYLAIVVLLGILISGLGLSTAFFSQRLIDQIIPVGDWKKLVMALLLLTIILMFRNVVGLIRGKILLRQSVRFNTRVVQDLFSRLVRLPKTFFDSYRTGDIISRINDSARIQSAVAVLVGSSCIDLMVIGASTLVIFQYSAAVGSIILVSILVFVALLMGRSRALFRHQKDTLVSYSMAESHFIDTIKGITTIQAAYREAVFETINNRIYSLYQQNVSRLGVVQLNYSLTSETIALFSQILIFGASSVLVMQGLLLVGELVAILALANTVFPAVGRLIIFNVQIQEARVAFQRMFEMSSIDEDKHEGAAAEFKDITEVAVRDVSFRFPGQKQLLKNISLQLTQNQITGLLGDSGSGKTTLIQLLQKFYEVEDGEITSNGVSLQNVDGREWRKCLGVVNQDFQIFNGSILFNIALSEQEPALERARTVVAGLGFESYFSVLPDGVNTLVGDQGVILSGGQRQLVALCRAMFGAPKLLILDEPTSAMDPFMEQHVIDLLINIKQQIPVIIVTHRTEVARRCDRIYVMKGGRIVFSGRPSDFMASNVANPSILLPK